MMFGFFGKKEKFLLLDVSSEKIGGILMSLDEKKKIKKEKSFVYKDDGISSGYKLPKISGAKVIVSSPPESAVKIYIRLQGKRENSGAPLDKIELENILSQSIGRTFNRCRNEAAGFLGVDDLDVILVGSGISGFELDGHKVVNPLGFEAEKIEAAMEMTFTTREIFEKVKPLRKGSVFFFTERSYAEAAAIGKIISQKVNFLSVGAGKSYFYHSEKDNIALLRTEIKWSTGDIIEKIAGNWSLKKETAGRIYEYYEGEGFSPRLEKYIGKAVSKEVKNIRLQAERMRTSPKIYARGINPRIIGGKPFHKPPAADFFDKSGFTIERGSFGSLGEALFKLAPFFEFYYDSNKGGEINSWLKRRLHWLGLAI